MAESARNFGNFLGGSTEATGQESGNRGGLPRRSVYRVLSTEYKVRVVENRHRDFCRTCTGRFRWPALPSSFFFHVFCGPSPAPPKKTSPESRGPARSP